MKKFTFKKHERTGKYCSFQQKSSDVKLNKKVVGTISEVNFDEWRVSFAIKKEKTKEDPAPFKWLRLKKVCKSEDDIREFVNKYADQLQEKYDFHFFDD